MSSVMLVSVGVLSDVAKNYILETMARAEFMLDSSMHWIKRNPGGKYNKPASQPQQRLVYSPVVSRTTSSNSLLQKNVTVDYSSISNVEEAVPPRPSPIPPLMQAAVSLSQHGTPRAMTPTHSVPGTPDANRGRKLQNQLGRVLLQMQQQQAQPATTKYIVKSRKFEVNSLCRIFLGKPALRVYTAFICLYIYCTLWAYTSGKSRRIPR